ncbi:MAG: hypothetical protein ACE5E1_01505 [Phycisphaerae bacterium]
MPGPWILAAGLLVAGPACTNDQATRDAAERLTEIQRLQDRVASLTHRLAQQGDQLRDQAGIVQSLRSLPEGRKIEDLIHVDRIEIERLSGGYDDNGDGVDEGIRLHLRLYDQFGGTLRARGLVRVKLLDLAAEPEQQLVGHIALDPDALDALWLGRFLTSHYTITVPWHEGIASPDHRRITILVSFTDLLSGRTFEAQRPVEIHVASQASG